jgi:hypothetical protein
MGIEEAKSGGVSDELALTAWLAGLTASSDLTASSSGFTVSA